MCVECDSCVHLLVDDVELLEHNITTMVQSLENINVGVLAMRRLNRINVTVIELQPIVNLLTDSPTDPTQLDPLKRELASVQRLSDDVSIRVCPHSYSSAPWDVTGGFMFMLLYASERC